MRPKQQTTTQSGDLFRSRLEQIINMKHELVQLAGKIVNAASIFLICAEVKFPRQRHSVISRRRDLVLHFLGAAHGAAFGLSGLAC